MPGYGSADDFQSWATARGYTPATGNVDAALLRASIYIDGAYYNRFPGEPAGGAAQERAWPRTNAVDRFGAPLASNAVPTRVEYAAYEAALLELQTPGFFSKTYTAAERKVLTEVKGIKWTIVGDSKGEMAEVPMSTTIYGILAPILVPAEVPGVLVV